MYLKPLGDRALIVYFEEGIAKSLFEKVYGLKHILSLKNIPGIYAYIPGYSTLTIRYDPYIISFSSLKEEIESIDIPLVFRKKEGKLHKIPVVYGGEYGPDLEYVAKYHDISPKDVIKYHTQREYLVYMLGFTPGFVYLGELPPAIWTPRLLAPRKKVAAGSVGIADRQTGIYAVSSPGGWQIIGRTYYPLFTPDKEPPVALYPGDKVLFYPIEKGEFLSRVTKSLYKTKVSGYPLFKVLDPGPFSIIVDRGRIGYQDIGFSDSGAADLISFKLSNLLLGNPENVPVLEIFAQGFAAEVLKDTLISLVGGEFEIKIDGYVYKSNRKIFLREGNILRVTKRINGARLYLSPPGGFDVPLVLGSASLDEKAGIGGLYGRPLKRGDVLYAKRRFPNTIIHKIGKSPYRKEDPILLRFIPGPNLEHFTKEGFSLFCKSIYEISRDSNRMGYRLIGPKIAHSERGAGIISEGVVPGAIQVPGSGMPIVMGPDAQPLGGYAKIGVVIEADLSKLSQALPGDRVKFLPITLEEALSIYKRKVKEVEGLLRVEGKRYLCRVGDRKYNVEIEEDT